MADDKKIVRLVPLHPARVDDVLAAAKAANLSQVVVIGWDEHDRCFFDSTYEDGPPVLWLLKVAERALLDEAYDEETTG